MRNGKILLVLLKTAIFTAIVPYAVGLWLPTEVRSAFSESAIRIEPERWKIILRRLLLICRSCDLSVLRLGLQRERPGQAGADRSTQKSRGEWALSFCSQSDVRWRVFADNFSRCAFLVVPCCSLSGACCYVRSTVHRAV